MVGRTWQGQQSAYLEDHYLHFPWFPVNCFKEWIHTSLRIQTLYPKTTEKTWGTHSIETMFMSSKGPIEYKAATAKTTSKLCQILSVQHQNQHESIQFGLCCESQINPAKECQYQSFSNSMGHKIQPWDLGQLLRRFSTWFLVMCTLTNHSEALKPLQQAYSTYLFRYVAWQPVETFIQAFSWGGTGALDVPVRNSLVNQFNLVTDTCDIRIYKFKSTENFSIVTI
jgi:hypothetical protein